MLGAKKILILLALSLGLTGCVLGSQEEPQNIGASSVSYTRDQEPRTDSTYSIGDDANEYLYIWADNQRVGNSSTTNATTTNLAITSIASECLETDANGTVIGSGAACGVGGGGASALGDLSDVATTTATLGDVLVLQADGTFDLAAQSGGGGAAELFTTTTDKIGGALVGVTPFKTATSSANAWSLYINDDLLVDGNATTTKLVFTSLQDSTDGLSTFLYENDVLNIGYESDTGYIQGFDAVSTDFWGSNLNIFGGQGNGTGLGGQVSIDGGQAGATSGATGGDIFITGGLSAGTATGGKTVVRGGRGGASAGTGGDLILAGGFKGSGGVDGKVIIRAAKSSSPTVDLTVFDSGNASTTGYLVVGTGLDTFIPSAGDLFVSNNATTTATSTARGFKAENLISCDTIDTTAEGHFVCGSDATGAGGGISTIKENNVAIGDNDITVLDFLGAQFNLAESPDTEVQIELAYDVATSTHPTGITAPTFTGDLTGNADTATALAANGANATAGNAILGVDASGAAEGEFDVWTEAENTSAAYISGITGESIGDLSDVDLTGNAIASILMWNGANFIPQATTTIVMANEFSALWDTDFSATTTWAHFAPNFNTLFNATSTFGGNSATATALAANGGNCAAGEIALGVDALGAVEGCYEPTEADITDLSHTVARVAGTHITLATNTFNVDDNLSSYTDDLNHTATAIQDGLIVEADLNEDSGTPTDEDILTYDTTGANFNWVAQSTVAAGTAAALAADPTDCAAGSYTLGINAAGTAQGCTDATTEIDSAISTHASVAAAHQALVTLAGTPDYLTLAGQVITRTKLDITDDTNATGGVGIGITTNDFTFDATEIDAVTWSDAANASNLWTFSLSGTNPTVLWEDSGMLLTGNSTSTATSTSRGIKVENLISCDTIDTTAEGHFVCGTDATGAGGGIDTIKENNVQVGDTDIAILDFLGAQFDLVENPDTEIQIELNADVATSTHPTGITAPTFVGSLTGQADTVATITGLAPDTATTQATQGAITSLGTLSSLLVSGDIGLTGSRVTKGWFTDLEVTNAIAGSVTGNAGTVTTITGLAPDTATTQATQAAITSAANLVTVGALGSGSIAAGFGNIDNGTSNITSGGTWTIDVDGTDIGAAGSLNFGLANDSALYWNGTDFSIDTTNGVVFQAGDNSDLFKIDSSGNASTTGSFVIGTGAGGVTVGTGDLFISGAATSTGNLFVGNTTNGGFFDIANGGWKFFGTAKPTRSIILTAGGCTPTIDDLGAATTTQSIVKYPTNHTSFVHADFPSSTDNSCQWMTQMPDNYDGGTFEATVFSTATSTVGNIKWQIRATSFADSDPLDAAQGTYANWGGQIITTANDVVVSTSTTLTAGGTPAAGESVLFEVNRDTSEDNRDDHGRLIHIKLEYTIDSEGE